VSWDAGALIALCACWLSSALSLSLALFGRKRRDMSYRWLGAGVLVMLTGGVFGQFARIRRWPASQLLIIDDLNMVLVLAGAACVVVSAVAWMRSRRTGASRL